MKKWKYRWKDSGGKYQFAELEVPDDAELMACTKDGEEFYEGDVIRHKYEIFPGIRSNPLTLERAYVLRDWSSGERLWSTDKELEAYEWVR